MTDRLERRQAIRRLISDAAGGPDAASTKSAAAAVSTWARAAAELAKLIGEGGVSALYARALHLTRETFPWVGRVEGPPTRSDPHFADLKASLERRDPGEAIDASITFLTALTELLATLIGDGLSARILSAAWAAGDSGTNTQETQP